MQMRASYNGYYAGFPSLRRGFDSRRPLQKNLQPRQTVLAVFCFYKVDDKLPGRSTPLEHDSKRVHDQTPHYANCIQHGNDSKILFPVTIRTH